MEDQKHIMDLIKPKKERKIKIEKLFHLMPDGTMMTGKTHNKNSKKVKKGKKKKKSGY